MKHEIAQVYGVITQGQFLNFYKVEKKSIPRRLIANGKH